MGSSQSRTCQSKATPLPPPPVVGDRFESIGDEHHRLSKQKERRGRERRDSNATEPPPAYEATEVAVNTATLVAPQPPQRSNTGSTSSSDPSMPSTPSSSSSSSDSDWDDEIDVIIDGIADAAGAIFDNSEDEKKREEKRAKKKAQYKAEKADKDADKAAKDAERALKKSEKAKAQAEKKARRALRKATKTQRRTDKTVMLSAKKAERQAAKAQRRAERARERALEKAQRAQQRADKAAIAAMSFAATPGQATKLAGKARPPMAISPPKRKGCSSSCGGKRALPLSPSIPHAPAPTIPAAPVHAPVHSARAPCSRGLITPPLPLRTTSSDSTPRRPASPPLPPLPQESYAGYDRVYPPPLPPRRRTDSGPSTPRPGDNKSRLELEYETLVIDMATARRERGNTC